MNPVEVCPYAVPSPGVSPKLASGPPVPCPDWANWFGVVPPLIPGSAKDWNDFYYLALAWPQEAWLQLQAVKEFTCLANAMPITDLMSLLPFKGVPVGEYPDGNAVTFDDIAGVGGVTGGGCFALRLDRLWGTSQNLVVHEGVHTWVARYAPGSDRSGEFYQLWQQELAAGNLWDHHTRTYPYEFYAEGFARYFHHSRYDGREYSGLSVAAWDWFAAKAVAFGWKTLLAK